MPGWNLSRLDNNDMKLSQLAVSPPRWKKLGNQQCASFLDSIDSLRYPKTKRGMKSRRNRTIRHRNLRMSNRLTKIHLFQVLGLFLIHFLARLQRDAQYDGYLLVVVETRFFLARKDPFLCCLFVFHFHCVIIIYDVYIFSHVKMNE